MSEGFTANVVEQAIDAGLLDDEKPDKQATEPKPAVSSNDGGYVPPWKRNDPPPDPYTDKFVHKLVDDPHGVETARRLQEAGTLTREELEAVVELSPKPQEFVMQTEDPDAALELAARFGESGALNGQQIEALVDAIGRRETRREMEEAAKLAEEERLALEKANAEDQEADRHNQLRDRIWDRYRTVREQSEAN